MQYSMQRVYRQEGSHMSEHKHGEMDIRQNTETFDGFVKFVSYSVVVIFAILIFMAIFTS
jgi:hypothetical protein